MRVLSLEEIDTILMVRNGESAVVHMDRYKQLLHTAREYHRLRSAFETVKETLLFLQSRTSVNIESMSISKALEALKESEGGG